MFFYKKLLILLSLLMVSTTLYAKTLDKIVVTANRAAESVKEITSTVTVYEEEQIKQTAANNLGEFLESINMGHVHKYPGQNASVAVRGFRTETHGNDLRGKVLVLVDGRRAGTGNTAMLKTNNINKIEIIKGPAGVQYGSAAIGGVINVITKKGKGKPSLFVEGTYGSFNNQKIAVGGSGSLHGIDAAISYSHETSDDYQTAQGTYDNSEYTDQNISLNLGYTFLKQHRIGLIYTQTTGSDIGNPNKQEYQTANDKLNTMDKSLSSYDISYKGGIKSFKWNAKYFAGKEKREYQNYWNEEKSSENEYKTDFSGAQVNVTYDNKGVFAITTGADYSTYALENRNKNTVGETKPFSNDNTYTNTAFFIIPKLRLIDKKLILTTGVRHDQFKVETETTPLWDTLNSQSETTDNTIFNAGAAYNITKHVKIRAQYGQGFRVPSANELAADYSSLDWSTWTDVAYKGNSDLDPESSETYEAGFDADYGWTAATLTYFQTYYTDMIQEVSVDNYKTWKNVGKAEIFGFEGTFKLDIGAMLDWEWTLEPFMNATFLTHYRDKELDADLEYTSNLQASYGILLSDNDGFFTRLNITHTAKQDITDWNPATFQSEKTTLKAFNVANLTISKRVYTSKDFGSVTLSGNVLNLFNEDYAYVKGYPMPERNYKVSAKYDYQF